MGRTTAVGASGSLDDRRPGAGTVDRVPPVLRVAPLGDAAVVVELGDRLDAHTSGRAARLAVALSEAPLVGFVDAVPAMASVLVRYDPLAAAYDEVVSGVASVAGSRDEDTTRAAAPRRVILPACYDGDLGPDLDDLAAATGLDRDEVVALHAGADYRVHMIGFLPGFAYMGAVAPALRRARRPTPRVRVPARAVAVAGELTAVYPVASPGGWHVLASVPVDMFSPHAEPPCLLASGDTVRFEPVGRATYDELRAAWRSGDWTPTIEAGPS